MANRFQPGDQIQIKDSGGVYDKFFQFAIKHDIKNWAQGMSLSHKDKKIIYTVILTAPHNKWQKRMLAVIKDNKTDWQYIINCGSIKLVYNSIKLELEDDLFEI